MLLFIFFLMILQPPSSTLFPYTTLFRSVVTIARRQAASGVASRVKGDVSLTWTGRFRRLARLGAGRRSNRGISADRKSTRLNSSHTVISYAVFCLKKKKKS